jgi:streptogramin lyase
MTFQIVRCVARFAVLFGALLAACVGVAGASPLGQISEFSSGLNPGSNLAQVRAGPDGNLWFSDRAGAVGRITPDGTITEFSRGTTKAIGRIDPTTGTITEFSSGLNAGSGPGGTGPGPDGNLWFTDQGTISAMGRIGVGAPAASVNLRP